MKEKLTIQKYKAITNPLKLQFVAVNYTIPDYLIKILYQELNWRHVSQFQNLSEEMIETFQNYVNWNYISCYQKLSESFIEKFQDKLDWDNISEYQTEYNNFSNEFIIKFIHKLNIEDIKKADKIRKINRNDFLDSVKVMNEITK